MLRNCRECGAEIPADSIHLANQLAKCSACNAGFSFPDEVATEPRQNTYKQLDIPTPPGIEVNNLGGELIITRRWFGWKYIFIAFFALLWNGFVIFWHIMALSNRFGVMSLFGLIHTGVGLWLIYYALTGFFNTTTIKIGMGHLQIQHGPIPYPGNKSVDVSDIGQLYCQDRYHRGKNSGYYTYEVHMVTKTGLQEKLLTRLDKKEHALYVEQEIERFLGIKDRPVRGEMR